MISLIAAVARNGAIGRNQQLPWRLPEDMRYFRETTSGKTVIMGRKTWESLPPAYRPLPNRRNIVVSRNPAYLPGGGDLACSIDDALRLAGDAAEVFIIGGEELYRQTMPLATRLYITEVAEECPGDAFFPVVASGEWREISRRVGRSRAAGSALGDQAPAFDFVVYERR